MLWSKVASCLSTGTNCPNSSEKAIPQVHHTMRCAYDLVSDRVEIQAQRSNSYRSGLSKFGSAESCILQH